MNKIRIFAVVEGSKHELYYGEGDPVDLISKMMNGHPIVRTNKAGDDKGTGRFILNLHNVTRFEFKEDVGLE